MSTAQKETQLKKAEQSLSVRFSDMVVKEFGGTVGAITLTNFQQRLVQNYFMAVDTALRIAEIKRLAKDEKYRDKLPVVWANVNMGLLARNVVAAARIGLDPAQKNHINIVPYKNKHTNKYDVGFVEGYRGLEIKAIKYGLDVPSSVVVEVVYSSDKFVLHKRDANNKIDSYTFEIVNPFDRGDIVGGFYYLAFKDAPEKNRVVAMTFKDIEKRKPKHASTEFWGGEKDVWENGKKTGKKETIEGWFDEMCYKTVCRAAYSSITIDSQKIDNDYLALKQMEDSYTEQNIAAEIAENANKETINVDFEVVDGEPVDIKTGEVMNAPDNSGSNEGQKEKEEQPQAIEPAQEEYNPTDAELEEMAAEQNGPGF